MALGMNDYAIGNKGREKLTFVNSGGDRIPALRPIKAQLCAYMIPLGIGAET
jgi:hypothetical protein